MAYNTFPSLRGKGWPVVVTPRFKTLVNTAQSGATFTTSLMQSPLFDVDIPINVMTAVDYVTLRAFFIQQAGAGIPFYIDPGDGNGQVVVRFPDNLGFDQFMAQMYRTKTIKLVGTR